VPIARTRLFVLGAVILFAVLGWSNAHHWDEYFYLFSSLMHSPSKLLRYEMETAIFPPGFFTEKIGQVLLLRFLIRIFGGGEHMLYAIQVLYAGLLLAGVGAAYGLVKELFGSRDARDSALVLLFSPVTLYLAYKTLSEVPSFLFVTLGSWAFVRSFTAETEPMRRRAFGIGLLLLSVGTLCRVTTIVEFASLGLALLVVGDRRFDRRRLLVRLIAIGVALGVLYSLVLAGFGASVFRVILGIHEVVNQEHHPLLQRVFALASFVQTFVIVLPFAWQERSTPIVRVSFVWLLCAALPFLPGHEPRYYAPALIPFAILSAVGLRAAASTLIRATPHYAWVGLLVLLVLVNRVLLIPLMPYEVEQGKLLGLFHRLQAKTPGATYLMSWISDYSLLRFSFPGSRLDLSLSTLADSRVSRPGLEGQLSPADQWWAAMDRYVGTRARLATKPRPWEYIGWTYNPATLKLTRLLARLGLPPPNAAKLHNHLAGSWIWSDPSLKLTLADRSGQYYVYEVTPR
jgi:hypothetical protein